MTEIDRNVIGVIIIPPAEGAPFRADGWRQSLGGRRVLDWTCQRLARMTRIDRLVLVGSAQVDIADLPAQCNGKPVLMHCSESLSHTAQTRSLLAARKWCMTGWRGGLGGATVFDEIFFGKAILEVIQSERADAAVIVGADWPWVDPQWCDQIVQRYRDASEISRFVFSQAPPGLVGYLLDRQLLEEMVLKQGYPGLSLDFRPNNPQVDPIAKDPCVRITPAIRNARVRAIYDAPRWREAMSTVVSAMGDTALHADAESLAVALDQQVRGRLFDLPQQVTVELNTARRSRGPIVPQHHLSLDRPEMTRELFSVLIEELAPAGDVVLTLGGLGDALLHEHWAAWVEMAHGAGIWGIHLETDLLVNDDLLQQVIASPIDVLSIRVNADTQAVYGAQVDPDDPATPGTGSIRRYFDRMSRMLDIRRRRETMLPWLVPRLVKTHRTLVDLEPFFDRSLTFCGHALIEPFATGCGLIEDQSPMDMAPPARYPCLQLGRRLSVHADGQVVLCDQDWLGREPVGRLGDASVPAMVRQLQHRVEQHQSRQWDAMTLCRQCRMWHRP